MSHSLYSPTEVVFGKGCVKSFDRFSGFGSKCVIITGKNMYKRNSALSDTIFALEKCGIEYIVIKEAENNPSVKSVISFASQILEFGAEFIIGLGGGSSMDTAKATAIAAADPDICENNIFSVPYSAPALPVILIGTTAGTGSEVMASSVLTVPGDIPIKKSVKTRNSYAKIALCDPSYTYSMPMSLTVSTALDSICHSIEAAYSKRGSEWARIYGHSSLKKVYKSLIDFIDGKGDIEKLREDLYFGSILAGLAINDGGTSFPHSMGYMLTTMHDAPHGFACAVFISRFLERVASICDVSDTLAACGLSSVNEFSDQINEIVAKFYNKPSISSELAKKYAELAMQMNVNNNYLDLVEKDCFEIYMQTTGGIRND